VNRSGNSSFIDHCFVSGSFWQRVLNVQICESGANLSDHMPLIINLHCPHLTLSDSQVDNARVIRRYSWRWDKTDKSAYYDCSSKLFRCWLQNLGLSGDFSPVVIEAMYSFSLDDLYNAIVSSLHDVSVQTVLRVPQNSLKPLCNDELDSLKLSAIFWHNIWVSAGSPGSGYVHQLKCSSKLLYKKKLEMRVLLLKRDMMINFFAFF